MWLGGGDWAVKAAPPCEAVNWTKGWTFVDKPGNPALIPGQYTTQVSPLVSKSYIYISTVY